jgi:hypothetical protein
LGRSPTAVSTSFRTLAKLADVAALALFRSSSCLPMKAPTEDETEDVSPIAVLPIAKTIDCL